MFLVIGLLVLALLFLIPFAVAFRTHGRSRRHRDCFLLGLFAGSASVGLVGVWIAVMVIFIPAILTTSVGFWTTFGVVITTPVATIWLTRDWLRS